jgi:hypothetical protein
MSASLLKAIKEAERRVVALEQRSRLADYRDNPAAYITDWLGQRMWEVQETICQRLMESPHKVMIKACHSVGKTWLCAALVNWFYDSFPTGACITTAPTHRDVCDLLWREVRLLRGGPGGSPHRDRGGFPGASMPLLYSAPDHYAKGFTAAKGESFQGRHQTNMLFIFDEAIGVKPVFWETTKSMFKPDGGHFWVVIGNPTDTSSQMYSEELTGDWHLVQMSALDHPNLERELRGEGPEYPAAVSLAQWNSWLQDWCDTISTEDADSTCIEWPPASGNWYRPGPEMEARALGRWPSQGTYGVWSDSAWNAALCGDNLSDSPFLKDVPVIGCDPARYGDDYTAIHCRCGGVSLAHERHNGWDGPRIVGRLKELCREMAAWVNARREPGLEPIKPEQIRVNIDADGMGGLGTVDWGGGYHFCGIGAATTASDPTRYDRKRSELWFNLAARAKLGMLDLSRLDAKTRQRLRQQLMAPIWTLDGSGRRVVEPKDKTKERLGMGSPDDADAINLAYYDGGFEVPEVLTVETPRSFELRYDSAQRRRGWFGRT